MKVLYLSYRDDLGGAFIGAKRLHKALLRHGVDSKMIVRSKVTSDPTVFQYKVNIKPWQQKFNDWVVLKYPKWKSFTNESTSFNLRHSGVHNIVNDSDADCVILHWLGLDTISIREIALINKPIIWRLADMWAFSGCMHYNNDEHLINLENSPNNSSTSIDQLIWRRKLRNWQSLQATIVCGSNWLAKKAKKSRLFGRLNIHKIPSSLDVDTFKPRVELSSRRYWQKRKFVILYGAQNALKDSRKGFDLLMESLIILKETNPNLKFSVKIFGHSRKETLLKNGIEIDCVDFISNERDLAEIYNSSNVFVIPSRMDNLPFTAMESLACGVPVVGFDIGGVPEIIDHKINGYIAKPFDCKDLSKGISWILNQSQNGLEKLSFFARKKALKNYSFDSQAKSYIELIETLS